MIKIFVIVYLNDMILYINMYSQDYIIAVIWLLNILKKYSFFANLTKCRFYKNEIRFMDYIVLAQGIKIKDK